MRIILIYIVSFASLIARSQAKFDTIVKHNGERLTVTVVSVDEKIVYTYPDENILIAVSKNSIKEIIFHTGRIQQCSEKIIVTGEDDWEKVIITNEPEDVKGLVRKGEVRSTASNDWNFKGKMGVDTKATRKFKQAAAKLKAHIILVQDQKKTTTTFWSGDSSSKYGVAYGYQ